MIISFERSPARSTLPFNALPAKDLSITHLALLNGTSARTLHLCDGGPRGSVANQGAIGEWLKLFTPADMVFVGLTAMTAAAMWFSCG